MSPQEGTPSVAVVGAAGQTGKRIVQALTSHGARVRALVHRDDQVPRVPEASEASAVALEDMAGLTRAFTGVDAAYYIPPAFDAREEQYGANVIAAAERAGLARLIYHSVMHSATPSMVHHERKAKVELALRESPLEWTVLQPCIYSQTILRFLSEDGMQLRVGFSPEQWFTPIDLEDLAEAAASVLLESGHEYANYELAGSERLNIMEMARVISTALGKDVGVTSLTPAAVRRRGCRPPWARSQSRDEGHARSLRQVRVLRQQQCPENAAASGACEFPGRSHKGAATMTLVAR